MLWKIGRMSLSLSIWRCVAGSVEIRSKSFTYGENGTFRNCVSIRRIEKESEYPESAPAIPADWLMTEAEQWFVIRKTTASVRFRQERDIIVICQPRITSVHDILSGNY